MAHFGGADTEGEGAESTVCARMAVPADDGLARLSQPLFRTDDVHDAALVMLQMQQLHSKVATVDFQLTHLLGGRLNRKWHAAEDLFRTRGRGMIHGCEGAVGTAHLQSALTQQCERLRRRHLVDQVQVDVQHRWRIRSLRDDLVALPDLLKHRLHAAYPATTCGLACMST